MDPKQVRRRLEALKAERRALAKMARERFGISTVAEGEALEARLRAELERQQTKLGREWRRFMDKWGESLGE